ncbi:MAG TPA: efflux RND transporter periplasmic adaptor subunit [Thermoanaerobaculaceae bacterium]|nr:efflux RND transporter periplasmic adaptor subunit [Thermoanaerobaculaceae bacterium]
MTVNPTFRWLFPALAAVLLVALVLAACGGGGTPGARYQCPMHPTFIADKPGECPICGMRLVRIEEKTAPTTVPRYVCPMHPEVTSDKPGRCSECGMRLVPAPVTGDYPKQHKTYTCPMHPEFVTDDPTERCPKCGMAVVERPARDEGAGETGAAVRAGQETPGARKILYYRNPMNPSVTSPVPMKDEMGMDYVPVYADEVTQGPSSVPGLAPVQLTQEGIRLAGVQTAPAEEGRLARTIRTVGTVTADETRIQHFHTRVSGWVSKLYVNFTGQFVKQGQPVVSIYSPELLASQEEFLRARETAARFAASELPEVRKGGEELLAAAHRRLQLFDVPDEFIAELERTGTPQRNVTLLAHSSGYVTSKGIFEGQQVDSNMMDLFTITDLSHVWIDSDFYEYEASLLRLGQEATLTLTYDPAVRLTGRIAYIYPTLNPDTRTIKVRFDFANPGLKLKPGMFANVELDTDGAQGVVIPDSAIIDTGERQIVFVSLSGGRFEPRQVRVGVRSEGKALVLSGVAVGERAVIKANFLLDSESQLRAALAGATAGKSGEGRGERKP